MQLKLFRDVLMTTWHFLSIAPDLENATLTQSLADTPVFVTPNCVLDNSRSALILSSTTIGLNHRIAVLTARLPRHKSVAGEMWSWRFEGRRRSGEQGPADEASQPPVTYGADRKCRALPSGESKSDSLLLSTDSSRDKHTLVDKPLLTRTTWNACVCVCTSSTTLEKSYRLCRISLNFFFMTK